MNFKTHNDGIDSPFGTSLIGYVVADYFKLKDMFGKPMGKSADNKSDAEWNILFDDGTVATIYNYKDGVAYRGRNSGTPKTKIRNWHVGGNSERAIELVKKLLT